MSSLLLDRLAELAEAEEDRGHGPMASTLKRAWHVITALQTERDKNLPLLERYEIAFGDLCFTCSGSGEVPGDFSNPNSGGLMRCEDCGGYGRKLEIENGEI